MASIFDKLNTPHAVVAVLVVIIAVNGFLLFQQRSPDDAPETGTARSEAARGNPADTGDREERADARSQPDSEADRDNRRDQAGGDSAPDADGAGDKDPDGGGQGRQPDEQRLLLGGLGEAFGDCESDPGNCVRDYMSDNVSGARYIGGRVDLASASEKNNSEVLYFESSELDVCEFERKSYRAPGGQNYTVILLGEGSIQSERGNSCIPTA